MNGSYCSKFVKIRQNSVEHAKLTRGLVLALISLESELKGSSAICLPIKLPESKWA